METEVYTPLRQNPCSIARSMAEILNLQLLNPRPPEDCLVQSGIRIGSYPTNWFALFQCHSNIAQHSL